MFVSVRVGCRHLSRSLRPSGTSASSIYTQLHYSTSVAYLKWMNLWGWIVSKSAQIIHDCKPQTRTLPNPASVTYVGTA